MFLFLGDTVDFKGPCGGFEYEANSLDQLILLAAGGGITPGLQLIRSILNNPFDHTKIILIYYSDSYDEILYRKEINNYHGTSTFLGSLEESHVSVF